MVVGFRLWVLGFMEIAAIADIEAIEAISAIPAINPRPYSLHVFYL